jgi:hypothetical protein
MESHYYFYSFDLTTASSLPKPFHRPSIRLANQSLKYAMTLETHYYNYWVKITVNGAMERASHTDSQVVRSTVVIIWLGAMFVIQKVVTDTHSIQEGELVHGCNIMEVFVDLVRCVFN